MAFVLCWLPFHVGRTILTLSLGSGAEKQDTYMDATSYFSTNVSAGSRDVNMDQEPFGHSDSKTHFPDTLSHTEEVDTLPEAHEIFCDMCAKDSPLENTKTKCKFYNSTTHKMPKRTPFSLSPKPFTTTTPTDLYIYVTNNDTILNNTHSHQDANIYFLYYLSQYFTLVSSVLFYLSAAVNPLLYNLMSARYRLAVHSLINKHTHTHPHRLRSFTARHSTTTL